MARALDQGEPDEISRLLVGAAQTIARARFCWLATVSELRRPAPSSMGRLRPSPATMPGRFGSSPTADRARPPISGAPARPRSSSSRTPTTAFVTLTGAALLEQDESEVRRRWKKAYDPFFPTEADRANAAFLEVEAERLELWIRGVTPEPFGLQATRLERNAAGAWRLMEGDGA